MADVTGPISSLPRSRHKVPDGMMCDDHQDRPAVVRIQGETDSMGAEYMDLCQECADKISNASDPMANGNCDWCKIESTDRRPHRDFEEGSSGPVYYVCLACRRKENKALQEEHDNYVEDAHYNSNQDETWWDSEF